MNRKSKRETIAYMVDEESEDLYLVPSVKVGDGAIEIVYVDENSKKPYVGSITVYSNGAITCTILNKEYTEMIFQDYLAISGETRELNPEDYGAYSFITSEVNDVERFKRIKQFLTDNNIELKYASEEQMKLDFFKKYDDVTIDDLIENENKQEENDLDEEEIHPKHF